MKGAGPPVRSFAPRKNPVAGIFEFQMMVSIFSVVYIEKNDCFCSMLHLQVDNAGHDSSSLIDVKLFFS
jgi:hypothetical protein